MQLIDISFLNTEKQNKVNKNISCSDCEKSIVQYFHSQLNLYEFIQLCFTKFELLLWIKSNELYIKRKRTYYKNTYSPKDIILVDLGRGIGNELSYEHFAIVLKNEFDKVYVVPCSSSKIKKAYDSSGNLYNEYVIGDTTDGFSKKTVIMIREARWISKSRILKKAKNKVSKNVYDCVYNKAFKDIFESRCYSLEEVKRLLKESNEKVENLEINNNVLETENNSLKAEYNKVKADYDEYYNMVNKMTS